MSMTMTDFLAALPSGTDLFVREWRARVRDIEADLTIQVVQQSFENPDPPAGTASVCFRHARASHIEAGPRVLKPWQCRIIVQDDPRLWFNGPSGALRREGPISDPRRFFLEASDALYRIGAPHDFRAYAGVDSFDDFVDRVGGADDMIVAGPMPVVDAVRRLLTDAGVASHIETSPRADTKTYPKLTLIEFGNSWVACLETTVVWDPAVRLPQS